tara:strand:- start:2297 stop:2956 length:660 start_codon:yes stop_codon:yes gene_type:complete
MGYFRELPDVEYQNFLSSSISSQSYLTVKNLFRRNKLRDDLQSSFTVFDKYEIQQGARPDTVAEEFYGDPQLDWVVLMTAGILNVRDEWPLDDRDLYDYAYDVHGDKLNSVRYYETTEVKDNSGRLILPAGKRVNEDFEIYKPDESNEISTKINPVRGVSNWEYEIIKNEEKRSIYLLRKSYIQQFLNDMRNIMVYQRSSGRINDRLVKTENTRVSMPL